MSMMLPPLLLWTWALRFNPSEAFEIPTISTKGASFTGNNGLLSMGMVRGQPEVTKVDLCIIGGGISGLTAAITAAEKSIDIQQSSKESTRWSPTSILVLESDSTVGGRVRSDYTDDGFILDRGFAVFIEEYPQSKELLDYDALSLKQFLPGARVKLSGRDKLASVSDPLRRKRDLFSAVASPVGTPLDKLRLLPLFFAVMTKSIDELFAMQETDTLTCLVDKYNFSEEFISSFFAPFLEGIYLTTLENQSSRMFHFLMKMFTVGSTSLPRGGMQGIANQLENKANKLGVEIQLGSRALSIKRIPICNNGSAGEFLVEVGSEKQVKQMVHAKSVVIATNFDVSRNILDRMDTIAQSTTALPTLPQRSVGCIYYGFQSPAPLADPILILNGEGNQQRNKKDYPINNVCFPSIVQGGYAPDGYELCSVSVLERALSEHAGDHASLDASVRKQLSTWFPDYADDIMDESKWILKAVYVISDAQPSHYGKDGCSNVHGGRDCSIFQGVKMPAGLFVCGDHMATATFNGALESGVNAGNAVGKLLAEL